MVLSSIFVYFVDFGYTNAVPSELLSNLPFNDHITCENVVWFVFISGNWIYRETISSYSRRLISDLILKSKNLALQHHSSKVADQSPGLAQTGEHIGTEPLLNIFVNFENIYEKRRKLIYITKKKKSEKNFKKIKRRKEEVYDKILYNICHRFEFFVKKTAGH